MRKFKKALITGITGFVGSHLAEYLLNNNPGVKIVGLVRWRSPKDNILSVLDKLTLEYGDLADASSITNVLSAHKPEVIFHLAAQSYVDFSFVSPIATLEANVIGT